MRRLYVALGALLLLLGLTLWHIRSVDRESARLEALLARVDAAVEAGDWPTGRRRMAQAQQEWQRVKPWLGMVLRVDHTEDVDRAIEELWTQLQMERAGDYRGGSAALMERLRDLSEAEQLSLANLF